jgi:hypothetical protein
MCMKRNLSDDYRLRGESLQEIQSAARREVDRLRDNNVRANKKVMAQKEVVNAIFLWYCTQPTVKRDEILRIGIADLVRRLESEDPLPLILPDGAPVSAQSEIPTGLTGVGVETLDNPDERKPRKTKRKHLPVDHDQ